MSPPSTETATARVVGNTSLRIWGLTGDERLRRQLASAKAAVDAPRTALFRGDWVYDNALVAGLLRSPQDVVLLAEDGHAVGASVCSTRAEAIATVLAAGQMPADAPTVAAAELADGYNRALRKREPPFLMPITRDTRRAVERRIFGGAYKGVTDIVTRYVWPAPARVATRVCARLGIAPNQVTSASLVLVLVAMAAFWNGYFSAGLIAAWLMTFLDTVDGKLARVTLTSTRWGNVFDHAIDLIHPPFWWWAWIVGVQHAGYALPVPDWVLGAIVVGYVAQRLEEGLFQTSFGIAMHIWTRFDSRFRLITARRNPNLLILSAAVIVGRPDYGILAVAVWTVACLVVHAGRIVQAATARQRGPLRSWLEA